MESMDLEDVIDLGSDAVESVLRFHIASLKETRNPFIYVTGFKSIIRNTLIQFMKKKGMKASQMRDAFVPLKDVAGLAGDAAFRAVVEWNKISHANNHVQPEWVRATVFNLVGGIVSAREQDSLRAANNRRAGPHAREYLHPSGNHFMLDTRNTSTTQQPQEAQASNSYGFEPAQAQPAGGQDRESRSATLEAQPLPSNTANLSKSAWTAINQYAANPLSSNAGANCQATLAGLTRQPEDPQPSTEHHVVDDDETVDEDEDMEDYDDDEEDEGEDEEDDHENENDQDEGGRDDSDRESTVTHAPARRAFTSKGLSHHNKMPTGDRQGSADSALTPLSGNARKPKQLWTKQEETALMTARREGKSWHDIHEMLGIRTATACEKKYRDLNSASPRTSKFQINDPEVPSTSMTETQRQEDEDDVRGADEKLDEDEEMGDDADTEDNV